MTKAERLANLALDMQQTVSPNTLALGYLRYEAIRKLNPNRFTHLHLRNLAGESFDDMVDDLIIEGLTPPGKEVG